MIALALMAAGLAASQQACPAERALYKLRGVPGVTAGFTRQRFQINYASKLFFWVRTPDGRRWWFSMNAPNGTGGVFLSPDVDATKITEADREAEPKPVTTDPVEADFFTLDRSYNVTDNPPQLGYPAPAHLFAPGLGSLMWYNPVGAANGDKSAKAFSLPTAMYDLNGCAPKR